MKVASTVKLLRSFSIRSIALRREFCERLNPQNTKEENPIAAEIKSPIQSQMQNLDIPHRNDFSEVQRIELLRQMEEAGQENISQFSPEGKASFGRPEYPFI